MVKRESIAFVSLMNAYNSRVLVDWLNSKEKI